MSAPLTDPALLTLTETAVAIRERKLSSVELTTALLKRIDTWQPKINAFVRTEADDALKAARDADAALARGEIKGSLHGVPLAHKDMYYSAGKIAGCGSKVREGWIAPTTSTAVARLEAAGSFRLGALHMAEFAYGPTGHNPYLGHARNPWDVTRITGGSSSGSAAAVAACLVAAALGSDTGGSIRLPAHFCGVTGFKPTYGRVSRANAMPLSFTLDTVGPLARSVDDCALIMEAIAGPDPLDATTIGAPAWDMAVASLSPRGLKIGVPTSFYVDDLEPDVAAALDATLKVCEQLGASIVKVDLPDQTAVAAAALIVLAVEATTAHAPWLRQRPQDYGAQVRARLENGLAYSAVEYLEALRWRGPALAAHLEAIGDVDVVIAPASRAVSPGIVETDVGGGSNAEATIIGITRFMRPINYLGVPTLVVPAGQSAGGMPIGLQLIGRPFGDETLIALGRAFQAVTDHHQRIPELP
ncbi:MAG: amidase [Xanthobacteraceae bacterium]|nr:amidase [Xanthobacteraceae bacterium]